MFKFLAMLAADFRIHAMQRAIRDASARHSPPGWGAMTDAERRTEIRQALISGLDTMWPDGFGTLTNWTFEGLDWGSW